MVNIEKYIPELKERLLREFDGRLIYLGLQGSYLRGESTDSSDIDIMVVIDGLSVSDLDTYRAIIESMDHADRSCGFICSKADLANWNPLEIWHLLNGTRDYHGVLADLVPEYNRADIRNYIKLSLNNMYHELCHRYVHADRGANAAGLVFTYKGVFFILQNLCYLMFGRHIPTKAEMLEVLNGKNRAVLERSIALGKGASFDFSESFEMLFDWCQETLQII